MQHLAYAKCKNELLQKKCNRNKKEIDTLRHNKSNQKIMGFYYVQRIKKRFY